ncbi:aldose 1-epimerase family protein [Lignipirellula cremea]|uniref:DUF4432 domain-containing protein n=1 Tax=Lignipirellula cremea TaxID=2528010 RepID=A0A518DUR4_9BACT|nr:aldose 1-epimerase family protein [Lignipirellula cremea]QDU95573.1 hypothetical protein Pla8534_33890 [Lignipirellula cremea]
MTTRFWTVVDTSRQICLSDLTITPAGDAHDYRIEMQTLRGGLADGVQMLRIRSGDLSFVVLPTRGMSLWKAAVGDLEFGWKSPVRGPVHPQFVPLAEPSGLGWLDGFDEMLVRCGLESNGAPEFDEQGRLRYPLHGRIANKPAHRVEVAVDEDTGDIAIRGVVEETRFLIFKMRLTTTYRVRAGSNRIEIEDTVLNLSAAPAEMQLLYHINFGAPLLEEGAQFVAPLNTVVPRNDHSAAGLADWQLYAGPVAGFVEQVYFLDLLTDEAGGTEVLLKNAAGSQGVGLHMNKQQLPCFTVWKNTADLADGYVTGLEPGVNYPNPRSFEGENHRTIRLPAHGNQKFQLALQFHTTAESVALAEQAIAGLQGKITPTVHATPPPGWCS